MVQIFATSAIGAILDTILEMKKKVKYLKSRHIYILGP